MSEWPDIVDDEPPRATVLGIGSVLHTDDGVGVHVVRALSGEVPEGVALIDGGTLSFSLLASIAGVDVLIVIDAAELDAPPGTLEVYRGEDMDRFVNRSGRLSVHEVSIAELLDMARLCNAVPRYRALIAIQPEHLDWGDEPVSAVRASVPEAMRTVHGLLAEWLQ